MQHLEVSESFGKFQFMRSNAMVKGSKDPVVEHKGIVGLASASVRIIVRIFSHFGRQTNSMVCPPFVCQQFGGECGAENL